MKRFLSLVVCAVALCSFAVASPARANNYRDWIYQPGDFDGDWTIAFYDTIKRASAQAYRANAETAYGNMQDADYDLWIQINSTSSVLDQFNQELLDMYDEGFPGVSAPVNGIVPELQGCYDSKTALENDVAGNGTGPDPYEHGFDYSQQVMDGDGVCQCRSCGTETERHDEAMGYYTTATGWLNTMTSRLNSYFAQWEALDANASGIYSDTYLDYQDWLSNQ